MPGSMWWALTINATRYILSFVESNEDVVRYFRNVIIPDKSFFHTILGNSYFIKKVSRNLTYTDWSRGGPNPALINHNHINGIMEIISKSRKSNFSEGEVLFARKFGNDGSEPTALIDEWVERNNL